MMDLSSLFKEEPTMLPTKTYYFTAKKLWTIIKKLEQKRDDLYNKRDADNFSDRVTYTVMASGIQESINIVREELLLLEAQFNYKRDYLEKYKSEQIKELENKLNRCTYCGCLGDADTKHVNGYTILETCGDCEEEILEGCDPYEESITG